MKKLIALFAVLLMMMPFAVVGAQETRATYTVTLTEAEINASFRVTNPARRQWSDVAVDLQAPDTAVITGVYTARRPAGQATTSYTVTATYAASVTNGRIFWNVVSVVVDDTSAPQSVIDQINAQINASWRHFLRWQIPGYVTSLTITNTEISAVYTR